MKRAALWLTLCLSLAGCASSHKRHQPESHIHRYAEHDAEDDTWISFLIQILFDFASLLIQQTLYPDTSDDHEASSPVQPSREVTGGLATDWWN
ncbi:MAG: hypothetical protein U0800_18290 [Isosphaeraceae bacterium]